MKHCNFKQKAQSKFMKFAKRIMRSMRLSDYRKSQVKMRETPKKLRTMQTEVEPRDRELEVYRVSLDQTEEEKVVAEQDEAVSDFDVLCIYTDLTKLTAIEEHLQLLYRPFMCFVKTRCKFELLELECLLVNTRYEPHNHPALFIRHRNPAASLKVYDNGNISCQSYSYDAAALGAKCFITTMEQFGYSPMFNNVTFNVVNATFCMPFGINLAKFYEEYHRDCLYNPATHPYLTYKIQESIIKLAIFPVGYIYVLLSSNPRITQKVIAHILPLLYRHQETVELTDRQLCSGDINFKLLWENEFQKAYQDTLKHYMPAEEQQEELMLELPHINV